MPNHCFNKLTIYGPKKELERFRIAGECWDEENNELDLLSCDMFVPMPPGGHGNEGFNRFGYGWASKHWGTKWGVYHVERTRYKHSLFYTFDSAWGSAIPFFMEVSRQFPKLLFRLRYFECGAAFQGKLIARGGKTIEHLSKTYRGNLGG